MCIDLMSMHRAELESYLTSIGEKPYRAKQILQWFNLGATYDEMSNLPLSLRKRLKDETLTAMPRISAKLVSKIDGTVKYLFALHDGQMIESVVMHYEHGNTICVSSQAGCRMGCCFCASNTGGLVRNLLPSEILGQVIMAQKDTGTRISNIVMMGIGEPLDNYDNVMRFLALVGDPEGLNIGYRHISLSTCGVVPNIYRLAEENLPITLSISLHAIDDQERSDIMPVNRKWCIDELLTACKIYFQKTGRRISFEYTLIAGKNDDAHHAAALAKLLQKYFSSDMPFHVNLIPINEVSGRGFSRSNAGQSFASALGKYHVNATVRRHLGPDINASCGQLRRATLQESPVSHTEQLQ